MLWLYFDFPRLQLETQFSQNEQTPVAIVNERSNVLVQVNDRAKAQGVRLGMGLGTAAALCRDIQLLPYREDLEVQRLKELAQELYVISGEVSLNEPCGLWLGATNMIRYHNGLINYCKSTEKVLAQFKLSYRFGSGYSPLAAQLLARADRNRAEDNREQLHKACGQCSLELTPLSANMQEKLNRLGIRELHALLTIPLKELARRFDSELVHYIGRLTGQLKHPLPFYQPPEAFQYYRELPHELNDTQKLAPWLNQLLEDLEHFLRRRDRVVERIKLRLHFREKEEPPQALTVGAAQGEYLPERWHSLLTLTLENQTLAAPVVGLTLEALELLPKEADKQDFFTESACGAIEASQLVALLQARLGEEQVRGVCRKNDFRPEKASGFCRPLPSKTDELPAATGLRPSFLLPEPLPYRKPLELVEGPERIATGWWDGEPQVRDYYIARNSEGQWCWVFKKPQQERWFLLGFFG